MRALSTAATGMAAQQTNVEVISNNIANMNTIAFKTQRAGFQDLLYQNVQQMGAQSSDSGTVVPTGVQIGTGVKTGSTYRITTQGSLAQTNNPYDIAINGNGYFQILLPSGETGYTRAGNLSLNDQGQLVTSDGYLIQPSITIPVNTTSVSISPTGVVQTFTSNSTTGTNVGQLQLATFINEAGLQSLGSNNFVQTASSGTPQVAAPGTIGYGVLSQGYTEASNVDSVQEITNLISAQRAYEMNSKVITTSDQMLSTTNQMKT